MGFILLVPYHVYSNNVDTEYWNSIRLGVKLANSFKLNLEQSLRLKEDITSFKQTFSEGSISYNISKGLKVFIPVRYAVFKNKIKKRISIGISYKNDKKKLTYRYRSKFQKAYQENKSINPLIRNKLTIGSKIYKNFRPYLSQEFFHLLDEDQFNHDEYRISLGVKIDLSKKKEAKIFYTRKIEGYTEQKQQKTNVVGLSYLFDW